MSTDNQKLDYSIGSLCSTSSNEWVVFNPNGTAYLYVDKSIDTSKFQTNEIVYYHIQESTVENEFDTRGDKGQYRAFIIDKKNVNKKVFSIDWAFNQLWVIGERNSFKWEIVRKQVAEMFEDEIKQAYNQGHKDAVKNENYFTEIYGDDFNELDWI